MSSTSLVAPSRPERLGRYELLLPIGTGGMATVYLARADVVGTKRQFAVKVMHPQFRADGELRHHLVHEARVAASIRHPNVVPVVDAVDEDDALFLVMEYVEGVSLKVLLEACRESGELPPARVMGRILLDTLAGLHAAHEYADPASGALSLVHRDVTPHNILVGVDGVSKLTDFGIAKYEGRAGATATGVAKGKAGYMSPEQARGETLDRRADVWAAGVVSWEALTGERLFRADSDAATLLAIASNPEIPSASDRRADLPIEIDETLRRALVADARGRARTADAFRRELATALSAGEGVAEPDEVGAFVERIAGARLKTWREAAEKEVTRREHLVPTPSSPAASVVSSGATEEGTTLAVPSAKPSRRRWTTLAVMSLGVGAVVALLLVVLPTAMSPDEGPARSDSGSSELAGLPEAEPSPSDAASGATVATGGDPPTDPLVAGDAAAGLQGYLTIRASRPIARVVMGDATVVIEPVSNVVSLPHPGASKVVVIAADGRRETLRVDADARSIEAGFTGTSGHASGASAAVADPSPGGPGAAKDPGDDGLDALDPMEVLED